MKPYRGTLLATAVLLAALPLSSCGKADKYAETTGITLTATASSIDIKKQVNFTVQSPAPAVGYECDTTLEYQATGAGMNIGWREVPGTGTTRVFGLIPLDTGTLSVMARGKCIGAKEDWKYSGQLDVTVTDITTPITAVTLTANPSTVATDHLVTFTLGATRVEPCSLRLKYQYSGAGFGVTTVDPATTGQFMLRPLLVGTLTVTATGWCEQNPTAEVTATVSVPVTDPLLPTVSSVTLSSLTVSPLTAPAPIDYTLSAVKSSGCTLVLKRVHSGTGLVALTESPTAAGDKTVATVAPVFPAVSATATINASGWCAENPSAIVTATPLTFTVN